MNRHQKGKNNVFFILNFKDDSQLCYKIYLVLCNMCVKMYLYTVYYLHINVLLLGENVEIIIVIMGVINVQIFIIISTIS